MRTAAWSAVVGCLLAGTAAAQVLPAPAPAPLPGAPPPAEFAVGAPITSLEGVEGVRPPMPVAGAPIEVPPGPRFWAGADALFWRAKGGLVPPLVVGVYTSADPPLPADPRLAFPVSDSRINGDLKSGYRLYGGMWLDKPHGTGIEAVYTAFLSSEDTSGFVGGTNVILARPFVDVVRGDPAFLRLSDPAGLQGIALVGTTFDSDGLELNMLRRGPAMIGEEMHWIIGARYWSLEETLVIGSGSRAGGLAISGFDAFATRNRFLGPQVGGNWHWDRGRLGIDLTQKFAVGAMTQETTIAGASTVALPSGARIDRVGGLLALPSNIGEHDRMKPALVWDMAVNVGYRVTDRVQLRLGYQFLWVSSVLRPGQQIDLGVNPTLSAFGPGPVSGVLRPWYRPDDETFWMHGFNLGLAVQF